MGFCDGCNGTTSIPLDKLSQGKGLPTSATSHVYIGCSHFSHTYLTYQQWVKMSMWLIYQETVIHCSPLPSKPLLGCVYPTVDPYPQLWNWFKKWSEMSLKLLPFGKNCVFLQNVMSSGWQIPKLPILKLIKLLWHRHFPELSPPCNKNPRLAATGTEVHIVHRVEEQIRRLILRCY